MFSELLGTLVLVSVVLGASVPGPGEDYVGPLYPAIAVGVAIVALAHCFGEMSGAQVRKRRKHSSDVNISCVIQTDFLGLLRCLPGEPGPHSGSLGYSEAGRAQGSCLYHRPVPGGLFRGRGPLFGPASQDHSRTLCQQGQL